MKMQSFPGISHLSLILLVQLVPAQMSPEPGNETLKEMTFQEVFAKSACHPMEQLLEVEQELGYIYIPACVSLWRCSGCCLDEAMECHPTLERNITLEVMKIRSLKTSHMVELTFVEHQACECRIRQSKSNSETIKKKPWMRQH